MRVSPDLVPVANKKTRWRGNAQMARECSKFFRVDSVVLQTVPANEGKEKQPPDGDGNPNTGNTRDTDHNGIYDYIDYSDIIYPETEPIVLNNYVNLVGDKRYELSNHLGNVLVVVSDKKIPLFNTEYVPSSGLKTFNADVLSYSDYYPFGQLVPNRHGSSNSYRYGFQGQEKDDELKGEGNSINYTFRMHDPRIGRFFATDPLEKKFPFYSPYQFSANSPIFTVELEGLESAEQINETEKVVAEHNHFILRAMSSSPNFKPKHLWQLAFGVSGRYSAGLGAVGEGLVAQGLEGAAAAKHSSWAIPFVSFNVGNVKANPTGTWDVKLTLRARPTNRNVANGSNQGALVLNFDDYNGDTSFFGISLQDGPTKEIQFGSNQTINVLYETEALVEVKTLGQNKATLTNFKKGVDQAVKTAMLNKSNTSAVSVLAMDYDSYMKIYKENKTTVQKLYNTLTSNGAYLILLKDLTKDARQNLNTLITKVKSEVDGSKP